MSMRENLRRFQVWSIHNKFASFLVIAASIYVVTLPLVRPVKRSPPTAAERAVNPEIRSQVRGN